jgi:hypothetical protein
MLHIGRINIVHCLTNLPKTRHNFDDVRIDAFLVKELGMQQFITINMHGYFWEGINLTFGFLSIH